MILLIILYNNYFMPLYKIVIYLLNYNSIFLDINFTNK